MKSVESEKYSPNTDGITTSPLLCILADVAELERGEGNFIASKATGIEAKRATRKRKGVSISRHIATDTDDKLRHSKVNSRKKSRKGELSRMMKKGSTPQIETNFIKETFEVEEYNKVSSPYLQVLDNTNWRYASIHVHKKDSHVVIWYGGYTYEGLGLKKGKQYSIAGLASGELYTGSNAQLLDPDGDKINCKIGPPRFYQGKRLDVQDTENKWLEATVLDVSSDKKRIHVHYDGWPSRWDEWIESDSIRVAPFRTKTLHSSDTPQQWTKQSSSQVSSKFKSYFYSFFKDKVINIPNGNTMTQEVKELLKGSLVKIRHVKLGKDMINFLQPKIEEILRKNDSYWYTVQSQKDLFGYVYRQTMEKLRSTNVRQSSDVSATSFGGVWEQGQYISLTTCSRQSNPPPSNGPNNQTGPPSNVKQSSDVPIRIRRLTVQYIIYFYSFFKEKVINIPNGNKMTQGVRELLNGLKQLVIKNKCSLVGKDFQHFLRRKVEEIVRKNNTKFFLHPNTDLFGYVHRQTMEKIKSKERQRQSQNRNRLNSVGSVAGNNGQPQQQPQYNINHVQYKSGYKKGECKKSCQCQAIVHEVDSSSPIKDTNVVVIDKKQSETMANSSAGQIEDLDVVEISKKQFESMANSSPSSSLSHQLTESDSEVHCVSSTGCNPLKVYPHPRNLCHNYKFYHHTSSMNNEYCNMCYCYICDIPANECLSWQDHHCNAHSGANSCQKAINDILCLFNV